MDKLNTLLEEDRQVSSADTPIVKIAILDTGFEFETTGHFGAFPEDEDRLRWHDMVDNSHEPIDEDGHGTALTTLLLRVARNAEIYVFRIARSREDLRSSHGNIAEVGLTFPRAESL